MKKLLILASNPKKDLKLDNEIRDLENIIETSWKINQPSQIKLVKAALAVRPEDLHEIMFKHEPHIVHFCGHGSGQEGLIFENDHGQASPATTEALSNLFELFQDTVECIVLNACYSKVQADAIVQHINYVIGMRQEITDHAAIDFAIGFYRALAYRRSIKDSFKFGCNAIQLKNSPHIISRMRSALSETQRKGEVINDVLSELEQKNIPEHLKPILLEKEDITEPLHEKEIPPEQKFDIAESIVEENSLQEYRKKVKYDFNNERIILDSANDKKIDSFLKNPTLSPGKKAVLLEKAKKFHVSKEDAEKIIAEKEEQIKLDQNKYKQTVFEIVYSNKNDNIQTNQKDDLKKLQKILELSNAEARQIEKEAIALYREYNEALEDYEKLLNNLVETQYPLSEEAEIELNQFQQNHNLKSEDIEIIKTPIIKKAKIEYQEEIEKYEYRLDRYKKEFLSRIKTNNPLNELNEYDFLFLKNLQEEYEFTDEEKAHIEKLAITDRDTSLKAELKEDSISAIFALAFNTNRSILASGGGDTQFKIFISNMNGSDDNTIRLWDVSDFQLSPQIPINPTRNIIANLMGRRGVINSVAFSPDGFTLASGSSDKTVKLWDSFNGTEIRTFIGHSKAVNSVAFNSDGEILASGSSDGTVKLWDSFNGTEIRTLIGHSNIIHSVVFSPRGQLLASGSSDSSIKLWDVNEGKEIYTLHGHSDVVRSVAFSPDGKILASGSSDRTVRLWKIWNGKEIRTLFEHSDQIISTAFSPDGEILASSSSDGTIKLWDMRNNQELFTLSAHSDWVTSIVFTSSDQLVSGSKDQTIKIWKIYRI